MDIISRLERIPAGSFHYRLLVITGLGWMFDAMDTGIIAFVLPSLAKAWSLTAAQVGYIGSAGLVGMALGAVLSGSAADRLGREKMFASTLILYSIATGLCGIAWNFASLVVLRFLVGFGLGGQLPVAVTLVSEYAPPDKRGRFIVLLESFWGVGWLAAALIAYLLIPHYGWQMAFFIGAVPALYVFYLWNWVPESVRYLLDKGQIKEAHNIVCDIERRAGLTPVNDMIAPSSEPVKRNAFSDIWAPEFFKRTLVLWIIWFGIVYSYYGIFTWLPSLMVGQGYTVLKTFEYVLIMTLAQLPGYFAAAYLVDRIGRKATLGGFLALSAVAAFFFGQGGTPGVVLLWGQRRIAYAGSDEK
jgi:putative MFS transporter